MKLKIIFNERKSKVIKIKKSNYLYFLWIKNWKNKYLDEIINFLED